MFVGSAIPAASSNDDETRCIIIEKNDGLIQYINSDESTTKTLKPSVSGIR